MKWENSFSKAGNKENMKMKKMIVIFLSVMMICGLAACSGNTNSSSENSKDKSSSSENKQNETLGDESSMDNTSKILIAYFSRAGENYNVGYIEKGNTQIVAEMIAEQNGGTLFQIKTVTPYPENYKECTDVAQKEKNENARPELVGSVENMADYDVIFLGYPNWWGDMPMAVYTFLESYDFSGKTIVPFCTHEGSGLSNTVKSIGDTCSGATVLDGLAIRGKTAQESQSETKKAVTDWLSKLDIAK